VSIVECLEVSGSQFCTLLLEKHFLTVVHRFLSLLLAPFLRWVLLLRGLFFIAQKTLSFHPGLNIQDSSGNGWFGLLNLVKTIANKLPPIINFHGVLISHLQQQCVAFWCCSQLVKLGFDMEATQFLWWRHLEHVSGRHRHIGWIGMRHHRVLAKLRQQIHRDRLVNFLLLGRLLLHNFLLPLRSLGPLTPPSRVKLFRLVASWLVPALQ
jgi:hypothetical protein